MGEMEATARKVKAYQDTVDRLEPDITMIDPGAYYASAAISLKRIADLTEERVTALEIKAGVPYAAVRGVDIGRRVRTPAGHFAKDFAESFIIGFIVLAIIGVYGLLTSKLPVFDAGIENWRYGALAFAAHFIGRRLK